MYCPRLTAYIYVAPQGLLGRSQKAFARRLDVNQMPNSRGSKREVHGGRSRIRGERGCSVMSSQKPWKKEPQVHFILNLFHKIAGY